MEPILHGLSRLTVFAALTPALQTYSVIVVDTGTDAELQYQKVPPAARTNPAATREYRTTVQASHIVARAQGGSNASHNLVWEKSQTNLQRNYDFNAGRRSTPNMTSSEVSSANAFNRNINLAGNLKQMGKASVLSAGVGAAVHGRFCT